MNIFIIKNLCPAAKYSFGFAYFVVMFHLSGTSQTSLVRAEQTTSLHNTGIHHWALTQTLAYRLVFNQSCHSRVYAVPMFTPSYCLVCTVTYVSICESTVSSSFYNATLFGNKGTT